MTFMARWRSVFRSARSAWRRRTLVYYVSGHAFGHASRAIEIINALHADGTLVELSMKYYGLDLATAGAAADVAGGVAGGSVIRSELCAKTRIRWERVPEGRVRGRLVKESISSTPPPGRAANWW